MGRSVRTTMVALRGGFDAAGIYESSAYAVLYQVTGESRYADLSRQAIERYYLPEYSQNYKGTYSSDSWSYGWPLNLSVAEIMSYDLCYEAWPSDFRKQVAERLGRMGATLAARPDEATFGADTVIGFE